MTTIRANFTFFAVIGILLVILWQGIAGLGVRFGYWDISFGLGTMARDWWIYVVYGTAAIGAGTFLLCLLSKPIHLGGILIGMIAMAVPFIVKYQVDQVWAKVRTVPAIHDITTNRADPPMFTAKIMSLRQMEDANPADYVGKIKPGRDGAPDRLVSDLQAEAYPDIVPIETDLTPDAAFRQAVGAASEFGWAIVNLDEAAGLIEATDTTFWYGFKDDVIIRIRPSGAGSVIDVRSLSRVGGSDFGKNADRIRAFRTKITG
ncbi:MAG: DUF1499 domain-containing protein [Pseudomonadota bacterium]